LGTVCVEGSGSTNSGLAENISEHM
jgi:hypothetical protein